MQIRNVRSDELYTLTKFVVDQNFIHHQGNNLPVDFLDLIQKMYEEDLGLINRAYHYVAVRDSQILATVRTLQCRENEILPMQRIFDFDIWKEFDFTGKTVWHIGRFATQQRGSSLALLKHMILMAISPICKTPGPSVTFAECDTRFRRVLSRMGISSKIITAPKMYLGSETIPIAISGKVLKEFYNRNRTVGE